MQNEYLKPEAVQNEYGLSKDLLARWRWAKIGPEFVAFGKQRLYRRDAIEEFLTRNTVVPQMALGAVGEVAR